MTLLEHLNPLRSRRVRISCPLTPAGCVERLRADLAPLFSLEHVPQHLSGRVSESGFALSRRANRRWALPSSVDGTIELDGRGTRLDARFGWSRHDVFSVAWEAAAIVLLARWEGRTHPDALWMTWTLVAIAIGTNLVLRIGSRHDDEWMVAHLCRIVSGTEVPARM